jgi:hypothetical protein
VNKKLEENPHLDEASLKWEGNGNNEQIKHRFFLVDG